jgi:hypothetical protein
LQYIGATSDIEMTQLPTNSETNLPAHMPKKPSQSKPTVKPPMLEGSEVVVWKNITTKGFWHKRIVQALELTNFNVIINDTKMSLSEIDNVIVMNQHSVSSSYHYTVGTGRYTRSYIGFSNSNSKTIGDVLFMQNGVPRMTFLGVSDSHGLAYLANYEIKQQKSVTTGMDWINRAN